MRLSFVLPLVLCLFAVVAMPVSPARAADEGDPAVAFYEKGREDLGARAADALWKAADAARKQGLHAFAAEAAEAALAYDPDHKRARKHLGFEKKRGEWVLDAKEAAGVPRENERPDRMSQEDFEKREAAWRDGDQAAALDQVAALLAGLGDRCAAKGYDAQARRAREDALRLDPDCTSAREGLGYRRVGEAWLTDAQRAAREAASKPEVFEEASPLDDAVGRVLTKARSANVRAVSVYDAERTTSLLSALETTYTYYLTDIGRDPNESVFKHPVQMAFLQTATEWEAWLRHAAPTRVDFYLPLAFYYNGHKLVVGLRERSAPTDDMAATVEDSSVHAFTHVLNEVLWSVRGQPWLDEGLSYYYTLKVRGTTESWCVTPDVSEYGGQSGAPADEKVSEGAWRGLVRHLVETRNDMDLRMLTARRLNELKLSETVKAWSVVTWLMDTDRDGAVELLGKIGKASSGAAALEEHFGRSVEETDEAWREWVRRTH